MVVEITLYNCYISLGLEMYNSQILSRIIYYVFMPSVPASPAMLDEQ